MCFLCAHGIDSMKIVSAITGMPSMSKEEVDAFIEKKLALQIGTIDDGGYANLVFNLYGSTTTNALKNFL
jgi:hypothetical protein